VGNIQEAHKTQLHPHLTRLFPLLSNNNMQTYKQIYYEDVASYFTNIRSAPRKSIHQTAVQHNYLLNKFITSVEAFGLGVFVCIDGFS
jgi:hypothetical protein